MITKEKLDRMDQCRHLLDAPAPEVVGELIEEIRRLTTEVEAERCRLAACGVVAMANTPSSAARARVMHPDYMSASCADVMKSVDREMRYREALEDIRDTVIAMIESKRLYPVGGMVIQTEGPERIKDAACKALYRELWKHNPSAAVGIADRDVIAGATRAEVCAMCNDRGEIGGITASDPGGCSEPCPECDPNSQRSETP